VTTHDHLAAHDLVHRWWFNYDEGNFDVIAGLLSDDCHVTSRTDTGQHPFEAFIQSDTAGYEETMAWQRQHREQSPYPLRHCGVNIHVTEERGDELDLASYIIVTQTNERRPAPVSSGIVRWTLVMTAGGYRIRRLDVVLDSIESAPFTEVNAREAR